MKITLPENLATPFAMLMKGIPEELQSDKKFKNAVLVYLKLGGVRMARKFVEAKTRFLDYDPLEIDTGFRFPRLVEVDTEEASDDKEASDGEEASDDEKTGNEEDRGKKDDGEKNGGKEKPEKDETE